jgi:uncharacterized membrane protein YhaH (DUF805 family)
VKGKKMFDYYVMAMKRYFQFQGRSRRSEYWYFYLLVLIANILGAVIDNATGLADAQGNGPIGSVISLVHLVPSISAGVRRMHDINKSGWWLLVPFYNIYLLAKNGDVGSNRFGEDPKTTIANVAETFN